MIEGFTTKVLYLVVKETYDYDRKRVQIKMKNSCLSGPENHVSSSLDHTEKGFTTKVLYLVVVKETNDYVIV
jgi:hypothetical protein